MTEEMKDRARFCRQWLNNLTGYQSPIRFRKPVAPMNIRRAEMVAERYHKHLVEMETRWKKRLDKRKRPIEEAIAFQKFDLAIKLLKQLEKDFS